MNHSHYAPPLPSTAHTPCTLCKTQTQYCMHVCNTKTDHRLCFHGQAAIGRQLHCVLTTIGGGNIVGLSDIFVVR